MRLIETRNFRTCSWTTSLNQPSKIARCVARSRWYGDCLGGLYSGASIFHLAALGRVEICHFDGASYLSGGLCSRQESWRRAVSTGVQAGIPMPCFTTALSFYDGYRHEMLPANLIQVSSGRAREALAGRAPAGAWLHCSLTNLVSRFLGSAGLLWGSHL